MSDKRVIFRDDFISVYADGSTSHLVSTYDPATEVETPEEIPLDTILSMAQEIARLKMKYEPSAHVVVDEWIDHDRDFRYQVLSDATILKTDRRDWKGESTSIGGPTAFSKRIVQLKAEMKGKK